MVGFQIPKINRILAVRSICDGFDKIFIVLRKLVYSNKNFRRFDLWSNVVRYLLYSSCSLSAVDNLQIIHLYTPVFLLKRVVAELGACDRDAVVVEIEIRAPIRLPKSIRDGLVHSVARETQIAADILFKQLIAVFVSQASEFGDRHTSYKHAPKVERFNDCIPREFQLRTDRFPRLQ